jgi:esterase/lipase
MGGFVALQLASQKNSSIEKVITLGTKFNWSKESVEKEIQLLDPETILKKVPAFAAVLEKKHGKTWKELVLKTAALMVEISDKQFLKPEVLGAIHVPVLLGIADRDTMVSLDETVSVFKTLPNAQMFMLPHSKHPLESVNIALLSEHIAYFLNS